MGQKLGIDLGGTKIEGVVLDESNNILWRKRLSTPQGDYQKTLETIAELVTSAADDCHLSPEVGVGVGIPGTLSSKTGLVKNANSTCLIGRPLDRDLAAMLGRSVRLANDANCFALSEAQDGAAQDANVVFGIILGTGVGGGLVVNKKIVPGVNGIGGEWGHNPLPWPRASELPGHACYCGLSGCLETFVSGTGVSKHHAARFGEHLTVQKISEKGLAGDDRCNQTLDIFFDQVARGLASIINVVDPDLIVVGGGLSNLEALYQRVPKLWGEYVFSDTVETRLVRAKYGDSSGVRGAAWLNSL